MIRHIRMLVRLLIVAALVSAVAGCNTIEGAGRDLESAGEAVQDATHDDE